MANFNERVNNSQEGAGNNPSKGVGNIVNATRDFEDLQNLLGSITDKELPTLIELFSKLNKSQIKDSEFLEKYLILNKERIKLNEIDIKNAIASAKHKKDEMNLAKDKLKQEYDSITQQQKLFQLKKQIIQSETQTQKNAIDSWEKNFWGPFRNMFKPSHLGTYTKDIGMATAKGYESLIGSFMKNAVSINNVVMSRMGDQLGAAIAHASQEFAGEVFTEIKALPKALKESFSKGREKYFERLREKVAIQEEKNVAKFQEAIQNLGERTTSIEAQWKVMTDYGYKTFVEFQKGLDKEKSGGKGGGTNSGGGKDGAQEKSSGDGFWAKAKAKGGAALSGVMSAVGVGVNFGLGILSSALDKVQEIASIATDILMEIKIASDEMSKSLVKEFGSTKYDKFLSSIRDLGKDIDFEQIKDTYEGLIKIYGTTDGLTQDFIKHQVEFNKLYQVSGEEGAELFKVMRETGAVNLKNYGQFSKQVEHFSKVEGVNSREVMRDISKNIGWIALTGNKAMLNGFIKSEIELKKMGMHID
ncbi:MAG: hypothetical protein ABIP51_04605, partial [Bacteroidia bacterium]